MNGGKVNVHERAVNFQLMIKKIKICQLSGSFFLANRQIWYFQSNFIKWNSTNDYIVNESEFPYMIFQSVSIFFSSLTSDFHTVNDACTIMTNASIDLNILLLFLEVLLTRSIKKRNFLSSFMKNVMCDCVMKFKQQKNGNFFS